MYSGDVAIGLGGMAFNEIILQCHILEPVLDTSSLTLTKTELHSEKQALPLYSNPESRAPPPASQPLESHDTLTLDTSSPPMSPIVGRPSVRATLLLRQIHRQTTRSPSFILEHGLDGYSSYTPQKTDPADPDELSDGELEKFEIDSDIEDDDATNTANQSSNSDSRGSHSTVIQSGESSSLPNSRVRQLVMRGKDTLGSIGRAEVDMIFVSGCVSGIYIYIFLR